MCGIIWEPIEPLMRAIVEDTIINGQDHMILVENLKYRIDVGDKLKC